MSHYLHLESLLQYTYEILWYLLNFREIVVDINTVEHMRYIVIKKKLRPQKYLFINYAH